jgi:hypothetical protein
MKKEINQGGRSNGIQGSNRSCTSKEQQSPFPRVKEHKEIASLPVQVQGATRLGRGRQEAIYLRRFFFFNCLGHFYVLDGDLHSWRRIQT